MTRCRCTEDRTCNACRVRDGEGEPGLLRRITDGPRLAWEVVVDGEVRYRALSPSQIGKWCRDNGIVLVEREVVVS